LIFKAAPWQQNIAALTGHRRSSMAWTGTVAVCRMGPAPALPPPLCAAGFTRPQRSSEIPAWAGSSTSRSAPFRIWSRPGPARCRLPRSIGWLGSQPQAHTRHEAPGSRSPFRGMRARPTLTGPGRSRRGERPGDGLARPSHPRGRSLRVLTELLGHPPRATPLTEPPGGRRHSLPDLLGARFLRRLQRRHEQGIAACCADTATVHHAAHPGLPDGQAVSDPRRRRSASRAADSRDLTVPTGTPRSVAILVMLSSWR